MLILGYKTFRRGIDWYVTDHENIVVKKSWLYDNLSDIIEKFSVVSFDNLAIEQLEVSRLMSKDEWNEFFMGEDGNYTMYIDLVKQQFARCSIAEVRYDLLDDVVDMFDVIRGETNKEFYE